MSLTKKATENYAEYEQLVGGVETLFKGSADEVQKYAANAYKTAGLSANQYMETVTSFSASLLQSLGGNTEEAAKVSDMAITDMADNANKMGTSMESIQNAYQGFAKGQYQLLDNLKIGYGGTKEEMQRLLEDAEKFSGVKYDIKNLNDVYKAIHVVQGELGITGTTAKEASETISGSASAMKAAWTNLVTGIADDNADFDGLINNFVDSVDVAGKNIIPRVETTINGIGKLVGKLAPIIADKIPAIVNNVLPNILDAATTLINGFIGGLVTLLPTIVQSGGDVLMSLLQGILDNTPQIVDGVMAAINAFIDFTTQNLPRIVAMGFEIMAKLAVGIIKAIPDLLKRVPQIISAIIDGLRAELNGILGVGKSIISTLWDGLKGGISQAWSWGSDLISNFAAGIKSRISSVGSAIGNVAGTIRSMIHFSEPDIGPLADFHTYAPDMMKSFAEGIRKNEHLVSDQVKKSFDFGGYISDGFGSVDISSGSIANGSSNSSAGISNVTLNVYGAQGQDIRELANIVMAEIQSATDRRVAAWA